MRWVTWGLGALILILAAGTLYLEAALVTIIAIVLASLVDLWRGLHRWR